MRLTIINNRGQQFPIDVPNHITTFELKKRLIDQTGIDFRNYEFMFGGEILRDGYNLDHYDIEDYDTIVVKKKIIYGGGPVNFDFSTNINAINKRENIGNIYIYQIIGSEEGRVWGDHIYTDDSNIAKAAVLEGKCKLGEKKAVYIKMIEGKSSYSSSNRNGVNSISYGSWPASYIFLDN